MKRPSADETREAAAVLRRVLEQTAAGNLSDAGARGVVRRIEGAIVGLEVAAGTSGQRPPKGREAQ